MCFTSGFFGGLENTCIYLCCDFISAGIFLEPLYKRTKSRKTITGIRRGTDYLYDCILYLADVDIFPRRASGELLLSESVEYGEKFACRKRLTDLEATVR